MTYIPPKSFVTRRSSRTSEEGYILLALLLFVALLTIAAAAIAPSIVFQVRRDREEELVHRGVQYSRAIKHYYKKFNRYPTKIEDLESTNNLRFLRKKYKDPITGGDFKILYLSQVQTMGIGAGAGMAPGAALGASPGNQLGQPAGNGSVSSFGTAAQPPVGASAASVSSAATDSTGSTDAAAPPSGNPSSTPGGSSSSSTDTLAGKTFGGGPIAGVVSSSKAKTIREFNKKDHYNEWLFIYDPSSDSGGLLNTPAQPALQGATPPGQSAGPGNSGTSGSGFGNQASTPGGAGLQQQPQGIQPQPQAQPQQ